MKKMNIYLFVGLLVAAVVIAGCTSSKPNGPTGNGVDDAKKVTIFKSESCGCCGIFVQYMDQRGYDVEVVQTPDMSAIKEKYNIPARMLSCHTTVVDGYFVEGHVPEEAIQKLLTEKPDIAGIALPGMPSGSPGMPGAKKGPFVVYAVGKDGSISEFMSV
ncbi:DUF411 domain-containing protein [Candidatus Woesearchaeota archaeon]|nr:DUF411 domain-containing protein [Candidatus Woesearchaeota archaeon]